MTEQKNIPELRFPEFEGEWSEKKLGEVFSNSRKKGNNTRPIYSVSQELGLIPRELLERNIQNNANSELNLAVDKNDIAYNMMRMWQGAFGIAKTDCMVSPAYVVLKPNKNEFAQFYSYLLSKRRSQYLLWAYSYGLTNDRLRLYFNDFASIRRSVPNLIEQKKIASFFTAIDNKISQLKQKKTLLEQYKKGVMQKIFSQELRFRDDTGREFPNWEKKRLGEIGKTYNGLTGKTKENFGTGKPYIQYKQIFDDSRIDVNRFGLVDIKSGEMQNKVEYGDIFFTTSSETPDEIGTASVLLDEFGELYLNSFCFGYRSSLKQLNPHYSRYLFRSELFRKDIMKLAQGSTRYNMSKVELMKLTVDLPSLPEQTKIADFLSAIDTKINHTKSQIKNAELWKKGLLQKMFV